MESTAAMQVRNAVERICRATGHAVSNKEQLAEVAEVLTELARSPAWKDSSLRTAEPGEDLLYEIAVVSAAPSLYLVSDGVGIFSPPHCHHTWAVVAGIRGQEANVLYRVTDTDQRYAAASEHVVITAGESLILPPESIHSTKVVGSEATFHLHMYGRPLNELPSFKSRCYGVVHAA